MDGGTNLTTPPSVSVAEHALFLDVDGTLLDIADTPDAVAASAELCAVLKRLEPRLSGALALVSGRPIADIDAIFTPLRLPVAGLHGLERRDAGAHVHHARSDGGLDDIKATLQTFVQDHDGALLEDKRVSLALHYRQAPGAEADARELAQSLIAERDDLHMLAGKMVFEIKPVHVDKGVAIDRFMEEPPFAGRIPIFVGDDVTDEDGFSAVNARDGVSIRVGPRTQTNARHRIVNVRSVIEWLANIM